MLSGDTDPVVIVPVGYIPNHSSNFHLSDASDLVLLS
jgi:hypothetical protein